MNTSEYWQMPTNVIVQNNRLFFKSSEGLLGFFFFLNFRKKIHLGRQYYKLYKMHVLLKFHKGFENCFFKQVQHNVLASFLSTYFSEIQVCSTFFFLFIISLMCTHSQTTFTQSLFLSLLLSFWKSFITSFYNTTRFKCLAFYNFLRLMWEIWGDIQRGILIKD